MKLNEFMILEKRKRFLYPQLKNIGALGWIQQNCLAFGEAKEH